MVSSALRWANIGLVWLFLFAVSNAPAHPTDWLLAMLMKGVCVALAMWIVWGYGHNAGQRLVLDDWKKLR